MEFISLDVWTMIMQIGNLVVLMLLLKKFLLKPIQNIIAKRQAEITKTYDEAADAKAKADEMRAEYETRLSSAKEEASGIVRDATQRASAKAEQLVLEARTEAGAAREKAEAEIARERKNAASELKNDISALALDLAGKVIEKELDPAKHKALIDEFIDHVGDAS
ncbi:MAG: F0F1 ATP synthase subunit B [Oscillospiraceae bacterium]